MSAILHISSLVHINAGHPVFAFTLLCMYYLQFMLLTDRFMLRACFGWCKDVIEKHEFETLQVDR